MDSVHLRYSHKHPTLCTVVVDGKEFSHTGGSPSPSQQDSHHWRLPSMDPRDEGKFLVKLHTLDIYFWTADDAGMFVNSVKKILHQEQLEMLDAPQAPPVHETVRSPVVQQLENVAIEDPAYRNGQTRNSRTATVPLTSPTAMEGSSVPRAEAPGTGEQPANYAPLAYNPAAPAAPEPIKHREKTPPPPEAESGTGLAAAAYADHGYAPSSAQQQNPVSSPSPSHSYEQQSFSGPPQRHPSSSYASPPPSGQHQTSISSPLPSHQHQQQSMSGPPQPYPSSTYASPPPSAGFPYSPAPFQQGQRVSSVSSFPPPLPGTGSPALGLGKFQPPSFAGPPRDPNAHLYDQSSNPQPSPTTQILGNSYVGQPPQPLAHLQPQYPDYLQSRPQNQPPPGGYSNYEYNQPQQHHHHHHSQGDPYDVHNQVYRPTEAEGRHGQHRPSEAGPGQQPGKLEQRADRLEKGVNKWLKKLDKKIG